MPERQKSLTPRREAAKLKILSSAARELGLGDDRQTRMRKREEPDAKNLKTRRVIPLRLCSLAAGLGKKRRNEKHSRRF
ncbi:MAG: hypothetical protein A2V67_03010 [Deltaproteobacteria bacterium RBG_13_61_14]|nr:MAG: hypothetical protein A2V67_03010 [Deltaproteobacteria bacterium RBG_13_61_14]